MSANRLKVSRIAARFLLCTVPAAACFIGPAAAHGSDNVTIHFASTPFNSTENTGVTGLVVLEFEETPGGDFVNLTISNTTPPEIGSSLTAIGLEWPDSVPGLPVFAIGGIGAYFDELDYNVGIHPGWMNAAGGYDVMITSDGRFEGGNPQGAPKEGESQVIQLALGDTVFTPGELNDLFSDFFRSAEPPWSIARFQAVGPNGNLSDRVIGVPEPASLMLLTIGTAAFVRRRSQ